MIKKYNNPYIIDGQGINFFNTNNLKMNKKQSIYIKPSKRGSFTSAANNRNLSVQEFASKILNNKDNYSPSMVKKANFARNAAEWNKKKAVMGTEKLNEWTDKYFEKELSPKNIQKLINKDDDISYLDVNPNIIGDSIIAGTNIGNAIGSYFINKKALNKLQSPKEPIYLNPIKFKTRININPQLNAINEEANANLQSIKDNTKSSKVKLNRIRQVQSDRANKLINVYGNKENAEIELINKNIEANANIDRYNNYQANDYINKLNDFNNKLIETKSENTQSLIQNLAGSVSGFMNSINKNNSELRNIAALTAGYEDVSPELMKEKGIAYPVWLKQKINKRNNKR